VAVLVVLVLLLFIVLLGGYDNIKEERCIPLLIAFCFCSTCLQFWSYC